MAQCTIFWDENFSGNAYVINNSIPDFRNMSGEFPGQNWNDETSSIKVASGTWRFFADINYQGASKDLGPGEYRSTTSVGIVDNTISSVQLISG
ncbi:beta/gamma crystallin-related protein [Methylocapsa sp. S129]|uniref:beta/gamma crystallin-related protein n=1 Tax=Methylocapsa sp. S129 TaxID=1641869 RepID=UPI00131CF792|nr:beta/gamma crystallin-related protein [Methylocapsa sp. S129]